MRTEPKRGFIKWRLLWQPALVSIALVLVAVLLVQPQQSKLAFLGTAGLDPSWRAGITMAALKDMQFGRDIVFTFGPLGYVLEGLPAPELARSSAYVSLALAIVATAGLWSALSSASGPVSRLLLLLTFAVVFSVETLDYAVFAATLALLMFTRSGVVPQFALAFVVGLVAAFGCLSKLTLGLDVLASAAVYYLTKFAFSPRKEAGSIVSLGIIAAVTAISLFASAGWSLPRTLAYLRGAREIIVGYSAAMSQSGSPGGEYFSLTILAVVLAATVIIALRQKDFSGPALIVVALFLSSKHGLVRADWHVAHFYTVAGVVSSLLPLIARERVSRGVAVAAATAGFVGLGTIGLTYKADVARFFSFPHLAASLDYLRDPEAVAARERAQQSHARSADALTRTSLVALNGKSVDVMVPGETSIVYVNALRWRPLPVFQSYSAYTASLDGLNTDALALRGADVELIRYWDLDDLYPLGSQPAAIAELLCRYRLGPGDIVTAGDEHYFAMYRRAFPDCVATPRRRRTIAASLNADLPVPEEASPRAIVRAYLQLRPTSLGRIASIFWRSPQIHIEARYPDGTRRTWRIFAATAGDGIIVSPMARTMDEERKLLTRSASTAMRPLAIRILADPAFFQLNALVYEMSGQTERDASSFP